MALSHVAISVFRPVLKQKVHENDKDLHHPPGLNWLKLELGAFVSPGLRFRTRIYNLIIQCKEKGGS